MQGSAASQGIPELALRKCIVSQARSTDSAVLKTLLPSRLLSGGSWQASNPGSALKDLSVTLASTKILSTCREVCNSHGRQMSPVHVTPCPMKQD